MASLPNDPPSYDYYRVIFRKTYDGEQKSKTFYFRRDTFTKTEVKDWKKRRELDFKEGSWSPWDKPAHQYKDSEVTLSEATQKYIAHASRELAPATIEHRKIYLEAFADVCGGERLLGDIGGERLLGDIGRETFEEWINEGKAYKTRMKRLEHLNGLLRFAEKKGWADMPDLKAAGTRAEKAKAKRPDKAYVHPDEYDKVKKAAKEIHQRRSQNGYAKSKPHYREFEREFPLVFDFLINTGIRRADLLNLHTKWFIKGYTMMKLSDSAYTPKSQASDEVIPLTPAAQAIAKRWINKYGKTRPFKNVSPDWYSRFFKEVFKKALPEKSDRLSAHKMRDSAVMYLLHHKRYSPQTVQQITRHKDLTTVMKYVHRAPQEALKEMQEG